MWWDHPMIQGVLGAAVIGGTALLVSWFSKSKSRLELKQKEEESASQVRLALEQTRLKEQEMASQIRLVLEQTKLVEAQRLQAIAEAKRTSETIAVMAAEQSRMVATVDATHVATNSSRVALESVLAAVRIELKAAEVTGRHDAEMAAMELRATKEQALAEKATLREENKSLQNQLNTLALSLPSLKIGEHPALQVPTPMPVVITDTAGEASTPMPVVLVPSDTKKESAP